jgi:uncharacterized OsmC-like protein
MAQVASFVRQRQAPLRERYAEHPDEAITVKYARTVTAPGLDCIHGVVIPGKDYDVTWQLGIDRTVGGDQDAPNPGDVLCAALASCMDGMVRMVGDIMAIELTNVSVEVVGDVDVRGTMAIDPAAPIGFRSMTCTVNLQTAPGTDPRQIHALRATTERLCVNLQTLRAGVPVEVTWAS